MVSQVGDGISKLALLWFVYSVTGSPLKTSIIGLLQTVPAIALAPIIGVAVDRLPKKSLLIVSDLVRAVVIGLIPCWMPVDTFTVSSLYILVTLHAVATAVFGPALTAAIPSLVVPSQYTSANALLQTTTSLGIIMGPALSGLGIAALSSQEVLCLNALTYVISAACFMPIRFVPPTCAWSPIHRCLHVAGSCRGLSLCRQRPADPLVSDRHGGALYLRDQRLHALFPVFARKLLDLGPVEVGYLWSMLGMGARGIGGADYHQRLEHQAPHQNHRSGERASAARRCGRWLGHPSGDGRGLLIVLGGGLGVLTPIAGAYCRR